MKKIFIYLFLPILLMGCVTTPPPRLITNTEIFQSSFDRVWGATVATFAEKTLPIESIDKESGLIGSNFVKTSRVYQIAEIPNTWLGSVYSSARFKVNLFAKRISNEITEIQINAHIEKYSAGVATYGLAPGTWEPVQSKGILEQEILDSIKAKL